MWCTVVQFLTRVTHSMHLGYHVHSLGLLRSREWGLDITGQDLRNEQVREHKRKR